MEKINFKKMIMGAALVFGSMFASQNANAQTYNQWNDIDTIQINQKVGLDNQKVYVYGYSTSGTKNGKADKKQDAAFAELGNTVASAIKDAFPNAQVQVVQSADAPSDGIFVKACLTNINWGSGALRTIVGFGAGNIHGYYNVQVSNAQGLMFEIRNHRYHDTTFASAKGPAVIKVYNKAIAKDVVTAFQNVNK